MKVDVAEATNSRLGAIPDVFQSMTEWWHWPVAFLILVLAGLSVKVAWTFNVNQWMEARHERHKERLKVLCPHTLLSPGINPETDEPGIHVQSLVHSAFGTIEGWCSQCGMRFNDWTESRRFSEQWANDPKAWRKQQLKYQKAAKKTFKL